MARSPYHVVRGSWERNPPPHIISCSAFRAYENHLVHLLRGFDWRVFTGIHPEKRGVEPVIISTGGAYAEFLFDFMESYFTVHGHGNSCIALRSRYDINVACGLQPPG